MANHNDSWVLLARHREIRLSKSRCHLSTNAMEKVVSPEAPL